jgi:hypothetical protein
MSLTSSMVPPETIRQKYENGYTAELEILGAFAKYKKLSIHKSVFR